LAGFLPIAASTELLHINTRRPTASLLRSGLRRINIRNVGARILPLHISKKESLMSRKRTPDQEPQAETSTTAVADQPQAEAITDDKSFADRVGKKQRPSAPDPFGIASDTLAGVRLFESRQDRQMAIKFGEGRPEDKPSQAVIDKLKDADYRWNPMHKIWAHPVRGDSAMRTRIDAERLYQELRTMIRQEKGIEAPAPEVPF
jgi:hypothetical protein